MNRRRFIGGASALGLTGMFVYAQVSEERIDTLEETVSDLNNRVSTLEIEVSIPSGQQSASSQSGTPAETDLQSDGLILRGKGTFVSDKFALEPGRYRVDATLEGINGFTGFIVTLYGPSSFEESVFNELIEASGAWEGSVIANPIQAGEYFVEVSNTEASWTLTFSSF